jgi:tungstate transport system substrate-binding protein
MDRRSFLKAIGAGGAAIGALAACSAAPAASPSATPEASAAGTVAAGSAARPDVVRLSTVVIPNDSGLYKEILPEFERRTGYKVELAGAQDVHGPARSGKADIVLSHYQHEGVAPFMTDGFGEWPRMVFSSPGAIIGPAADPAKVRGLSAAVEAFRRIAKAGGPFVVNDQDGLRYVSEVIARAGDVELSGSWYADKGVRGPMAMQAAAQAGGYTIWGLVPFLRSQQQQKLALEPLVMNDQMLKSVMVTIVVSDKRVSGVNAKGARALQRYLIEPGTQARIRTFRMSGVSEQVWWPAAQDNDQAAFASP